jgi:hypothetical protein
LNMVCFGKSNLPTMLNHLIALETSFSLMPDSNLRLP